MMGGKESWETEEEEEEEDGKVEEEEKEGEVGVHVIVPSTIWEENNGITERVREVM